MAAHLLTSADWFISCKQTSDPHKQTSLVTERRGQTKQITNSDNGESPAPVSIVLFSPLDQSIIDSYRAITIDIVLSIPPDSYNEPISGSSLQIAQAHGLTFSCSGSEDFNSCVKTTLQSIVRQLSASGAPELGISRLDPAKLPNMDFDVKRKGAIEFSSPFGKVSELAANIRLFNTTAIGFSRLKMLSVRSAVTPTSELNQALVSRSEVKKSAVKADIQLMVPQVLMRGRFYINGRFGVWPIAGGGPYNITTGELRGEWRLRGRQINHEGTTRLQLEECKLTPRLSYLHLEADNFLRSNPALKANDKTNFKKDNYSKNNTKAYNKKDTENFYTKNYNTKNNGEANHEENNTEDYNSNDNTTQHTANNKEDNKI
ncbi:unnamed protein product [Nezara viridula]|uniref:Uncharacterized protein n=1 Tax=Nezara viridula TaxID=85310 RepID=A0A9P0HN25_NEZVI|nr:unnamed protein product [Nezara viridula]